MSKVKNLLNIMNETGEMSYDDLEKGGEWYESRIELERIAKRTGLFDSIKPFDKYQGPYALLKNGDKIWLTGWEGLYYLELTNGETLTLDDDVIIAFYKDRHKSKPKVKVRKVLRRDEYKG